MSTISSDFQQAVLRSLEGIIKVTKIDESIANVVGSQLASTTIRDKTIWESSLPAWLQVWPSDTNQHEIVDHAARLALAITYLRTKSHNSVDSTKAISAPEMALVWNLLYTALRSPLYEQVSCGRSHQGFFSLPICRLTRENGDNEEFWRLHIWLPNSPKPDSRFLIHSHQSWGQSWILAGEAENTMWKVEPTQDINSATNAIYKLAAAFNKTLEAGSKEEISGTVVQNTGQKVVVKEALRERYHCDQSYTVPENAYHMTGVEENTVLATLFCFNASLGFVKEAGVSVGPLEGTEFKQYRNPDGARPDQLIKIVQAVRDWELEADKALDLVRQQKWTEASKMFREVADAWNVDAEDTQPSHDAVPQATKANEFAGLETYKEVALMMSKWAEHIASCEFGKAKLISDKFTNMPQFRIFKQLHKIAQSLT